MTEIATQVADELDAGHGAIGTHTALQIPDGLSFDEWQNIGQFVLQIHNACNWWIGDWLFYGEFAYGQKYDDAIRVTGLDEGTLQNYSYVSGKVETSLRNEILSWTHHLVVAPLPRDQQRHWLDQAAKKGWTVRDLREHLRPAVEPPPAALPDITLSTLRLQIEETRQARWTAAAEAVGLDVTTWLTDLADREAARLTAAA